MQTLLHEGGHAFHVYEVDRLAPTTNGTSAHRVLRSGLDEHGASGSALSGGNEGRYYSDADAARARVEHLERDILFWPYMAVVDAFQHWVYTHVDEAMDPLSVTRSGTCSGIVS
ncbi:MAG: hypothetical protein IPK19_18665 [Chloroflexi bacterium]|nr:hypothetical protein [Chloroflexota bacterium]